MRLECEVQSFDRSRTFHRQLFADTLLLFEAPNLMTAGTTVLLDEQTTLLFQVWIVHEIRGLVTRRRREREEISRDVARVGFRQAEVWHHRHVLHLQLSAIVWTT